MASFFAGVLQIGLAASVTTGYLIPTLKNTNTTGWTATEISLFSLATLAVIAGLVNGILNLFGLGA